VVRRAGTRSPERKAEGLVVLPSTGRPQCAGTVGPATWIPNSLPRTCPAPQVLIEGFGVREALMVGLPDQCGDSGWAALRRRSATANLETTATCSCSGTACLQRQ
jgi:hypothetical protein